MLASLALVLLSAMGCSQRLNLFLNKKQLPQVIA